MKEVKEIRLPASKSECNRLLVIATLAGCPLPLFDGECEDIADMRRCIEQDIAEGECYIKESGTALRFLTALFAALPPYGKTTVIKCSGRLAQRPLEPLLKALISAGMPQSCVEVDGEGVKSIAVVSSELKGGNVEISTKESTQYASALLLIAPCMENGISLRLSGGNASSPYICMTIDLMMRCGARVDTSDSLVKVYPGGYGTPQTLGSVEADWSAAAFFYEHVAINGGRLLLRGLRMEDSLQGDSDAANLFLRLGVRSEHTSEGVVIEKTGEGSRSIRSDMSSTPDLVPPLVAACCFTGTFFRLEGLGALRHKESDRIASVCAAMRAMEFLVGFDKEGCSLLWNGERTLPAREKEIEDCGDHRIAMAVEAAGKGFHALHPQCVEKSFPTFYEEMSKL